MTVCRSSRRKAHHAILSDCQGGAAEHLWGKYNCFFYLRGYTKATKFLFFVVGTDRRRIQILFFVYGAVGMSRKAFFLLLRDCVFGFFDSSDMVSFFSFSVSETVRLKLLSALGPVGCEVECAGALEALLGRLDGLQLRNAKYLDSSCYCSYQVPCTSPGNQPVWVN